jgi:pantoate--beta-alanine ligase
VRTARTPGTLKRELLRIRRPGSTIGFVPTLGALHAGHLQLMKRGRKECGLLAASIFVNPLQFGPREDFKSYPRDLAGDLQKCRKAGVDLLFIPDPESVYPEDYRTYVTVEELSDRLCGKTRPGHFRGVATVVLKLLNLVRPEKLYLGRKDYQQCAILRRMVRDLDLDLEVVVCPTVREPDGLAMSSRNAYLNPAERKAAAVLFRSLKEAEKAYRRGESRGKALQERVRRFLEGEPRAEIEYVVAVHPDTLQEAREAVRGTVLAVAVRIGGTRLIDNWKIGERL